jgi:phospholipid/cholesterol/gamma-HCH transport system permease protein
MKVIEQLGVWTIRQVEGIGGVTLLGVESVVGLFRRPFRWRLLLQQFEFIGAGSLLIVLLTGTFTGMVLSVQSAYAFQLFNAESLVGATVALALTRELAPVLTGLMVTGRVGSSIATEIGTMGVTEQIDALRSMAVNPVQYLVTPRVVAATIMVPILCMLSNVVGIFGAWLVGVQALGLDEGIFFDRIQVMVVPWDVWSGIIKSAFFGFALSVIACYKGYTAGGGARGVGMATTQAVVTCSMVILMLDYILTVLMF